MPSASILGRVHHGAFGLLLTTWLPALGMAAIFGCGEPQTKTYPVMGKIVFEDGTPLAGGSIELECQKNSVLTATGTIDEDGNFVIDGNGAVAGLHRVAIHPEEPVDDNLLDNNDPVQPLPDKYQDLNTSGLEINVTENESTNITLTVERRPGAKPRSTSPAPDASESDASDNPDEQGESSGSSGSTGSPGSEEPSPNENAADTDASNAEPDE